MSRPCSEYRDESDDRNFSIKRFSSMASVQSYSNKTGKDLEMGKPIESNQRRSTLNCCYMIFLHSVVVILCLNLFNLHTSSVTCARLESFSPANEAVQMKLRTEGMLGHSKSTIYSGPPDQENIKAWDTLLLPTYFSISGSDLNRAGETVANSVQLESGNYVAATGVYHQLHCIRQLRLYLYKETHYPNLTDPEIDYLEGHLDHCLEVLREEIMCTGDTSLVTFFWHDPPQLKPGSKSNAKRSCVNWESFEKWSLEHMVPVDAAVKGGSGLKPLITRPLSGID